MNSDLLTLDELCAQVALVLAEDYDGAPNDRVRDLPDRRTVRYYGTLGILGRPTMEGRTALYGRRHLLQLVAIKRLQANGLGLSEIQERLFGRSDKELAKLARVPGGAERPEAKRESSPRRRTFWKETPAEPVQPKAEESATERTLQAIRISDAVLLLVPLIRTADDFDLESLRVAARPLLKMLATRKLID